MAGKYDPLKRFLRALPPSRESVTLSFDEIQSTLGTTLPDSARKHPAWWANQEHGSQARSWMEAGFWVDGLDQANQWVRFARSGTPLQERSPKKKSAPLPENVASQPDRATHALYEAKLDARTRTSSHFRKIVLISCAARKLGHRAKARHLYVSHLFQLQLAYALKLKPDAIFILSAKYGLVALDQEIDPYEKTLKGMSSGEQRRWAEEVLRQLAAVSDNATDHFIILAGQDYRRYLLPALRSTEVPLEGLSIGRQLQRIRQILNATEKNICANLHHQLAHLERFRFPYAEERIPKNGLYVLYEEGERGHGMDRIVRIGTHTGDEQLRSRLFQHFLLENKDRSIFRKNIGRALLHRDGDSFLEQWELDLTTRAAKEKYAKSIDHQKQHAIELRVTEYIQARLSFVVISEPNKEQRLSIESKLISTVSLCRECGPSPRWLGNKSPKEEIRKSGLWNVKELYKTPFNVTDLEVLDLGIGV